MGTLKIIKSNNIINNISIYKFSHSLDSDIKDNCDELIIKAHENKLTNIKLSSNGYIIASSSERGTLIKIHNTTNGEIIYRLRTG